MSLFRRGGRVPVAVVAITGLLLAATGPAGAFVPVVVPSTPDLRSASDSGVSATDDVTNVTALVFDIATAAEGAAIELLRNATVVATGTYTAASAPLVLTDPATVPAGTYQYSAREVATPANTSPTLQVVVDRTAPSSIADAPDLTTDSGAGATDNITNAANPSFSIPYTPALAADDRVELLRAGSPVASGTAASPSALVDTGAPEGVHSYAARVSDVAGNASAISTSLGVTVDRTAAAPVIALSAASDTGRSNTDLIASVLNQATGTYGQTVTLTMTGEPGAVLSGFTRQVNGAPVTPAAQSFGAASTTLPAGGSVNVTNALGNVLPSLAPINGAYAYRVLQTDVAGNASAPGLSTVTIDTIPPAPAVVALDPTTDTGPSNTDTVTRWDAAAVTGTVTNPALKINVTGEPEARVELRRNGTVVTAPTTPFDLPAAAAGTTTGQITDPGPFPFTAVHGYTADLADKAGNVSNGAAGFTVDLDNPALPTKPDLVASSDLGTSSGDDVTSDNTPTLNITGVEETSTVFVYRCPGAVACSSGATGNRILLGTRVGNGEFTAPATPDNSTAITSWRFAVGQRDLSGRYSGGQVANFAEPAGLSVHVNVVIDTVAEPVPAPPVQVGGSSVSPTFNISKGTGRVQLLRDGAVVGSSVGAGDITDPGPLANGTYSYTSRSVDAAGNISATSAATPVTVANGLGYWLLGADGGVFSFGNAPFFGSTGDMTLNAPVMSMAPTPGKDGYWLLARDGGVFSFGAAGFFGSTGDQVLNSPIVGMVPTPTGKGYWLFAEDGGIFAFGDAPFHGSAGGSGATAPVVAMLATKDAKGYWLVDRKGKIYAFGSAQQVAGVEDLTLNSPVVGFAATPTDSGLWLVAADGGIFALGDAAFHGSAGSLVLNKPIIGMLALPDGGGYLLLASDGGVFTFGAANFLGSTGDMTVNAPIVGIAST